MTNTKKFFSYFIYSYLHCSKATTVFFFFQSQSFDSKYSSGSVKNVKAGLDKTEGYINKNHHIIVIGFLNFI